MAKLKIKTTSKVVPQCYAYTTPGIPSHDGWTKIGFTERDVETRIKEQTHTVGVTPKIWWHLRAAYMTEPFDTFTDKEFHAYLKMLGVNRQQSTEWFKISPKEAKSDFVDFAQNHGTLDEEEDHSDATIPYVLRDEQKQAIENTLDYFKGHTGGECLWNAKPRFGKTLSVYDLCNRMGARNILVVTNRPAIANSWYSDYLTFFGPKSGWYFVSHVEGIKDKPYVFDRKDYLKIIQKCDKDTPIKGCIEFVSLQDLKGSVYFGGTYDKLKELSGDKDKNGRPIGITWDILVIDEAHEGVDTYKTDVAFNHIARKCTLHLSGTPFKALASDKFPEDAIYNWTYADEQKRKRDWDNSSETENPYANLPTLSLFTYRMSDIVKDKVRKGIELADNDVEEYAFDLNEFFKTTESGKFVHDDAVNKFLDALTKQEKFPFSTPELRDELKHTFWLLNRVDSAKALAKKLEIHPVFKDYKIILAAGDGKLNEDDANEKSFNRVVGAIDQNDKTITLSVGQLTTGVTIPEWTAVLMLCNLSSPSLYMQAAFRAQNPCLFQDKNGNAYRKKNAYIFDFDPARTLTIFEQFANDLIPETSGEKGDFDQRKTNVRELLNFFPVYGEDEDGTMVELDAEKVLTIPRHIHAKEVVERGFMSNFLFANISGIFGAPKEVIDIINNMQAIEEPKQLKPAAIDENTVDELHLNDKGEVEIPTETKIGLAQDLFGDKVYSDVKEQLEQTVQDIEKEHEKNPNPKKNELKELQKKFAEPISTSFISTAKSQYGDELKKSTQNELARKIQETTNSVVNEKYGDYTIQNNQLKQEKEEKLKEAQEQGSSMSDITKIEENYNQQIEQKHKEMVDAIQKELQDKKTVSKVAETIVDTVETEKLNNKKSSIEGDIRDHLRGFSRTIPAFLMAYGDETTTLENFDSLVPADVFWEVTVNPSNGQGVTIDQFRFLRDGGDYYEKDEAGREIQDEAHKHHFDGHLFDEVVFNDAVEEFMKRRKALANYFDSKQDGDIFDYIPPQRTNQIFTPKKVVVEMVDMLEKENPGCFDDPDATFADLYMKSGMYITEIVKRLYQGDRLKALYPDHKERLNHIFAKQVYGCAPTEIMYRICLRYILGFSDDIQIEKYNIKLCDTLKYAENNTLEKKLSDLFEIK